MLPSIQRAFRLPFCVPNFLNDKEPQLPKAATMPPRLDNHDYPNYGVCSHPESREDCKSVSLPTPTFIVTESIGRSSRVVLSGAVTSPFLPSTPLAMSDFSPGSEASEESYSPAPGEYFPPPPSPPLTYVQHAFTMGAASPALPESTQQVPVDHDNSSGIGIKETCFFWYHGQCRRGGSCHFAHELHITSPIPPPPGYMHRYPCNLRLCPLRADLVALMENQIARGGATDVEVIEISSSSDTSSVSGVALINGEVYEISSDAESESDKEDELDEVQRTADGIEIIEISSSSDIDHDNIVDGTRETHMDISSDKENEPAHPFPTSHEASSPSYLLLPTEPIFPGGGGPHNSNKIHSISHTGTHKKKRKRASKSPTTDSPSPPNNNNNNNNTNKRRRLSLPQNPISQAHTHPLPTKPPANNPLPHPTQTLPREPPRGPRLDLICFHWYHKGVCHPRRRRCGTSAGRCKFLHSMYPSSSPAGQQQRVSRPPGITDHSRNCPLLLCPFRLEEEPRAVAAAPSSLLGAKFPPMAIRSRSLGGNVRVLVDYELPEGEDRADWDTDYLRRAFGEIE